MAYGVHNIGKREQEKGKGKGEEEADPRPGHPRADLDPEWGVIFSFCWWSSWADD